MKARGFVCGNCRRFVKDKAWGTRKRNHCPFCLYSSHVDIRIGDRKSKCKGLMTPVGRIVRKGGEDAILHKCEKCGFERRNRISGDDDYEIVKSLVVLATFPSI